MCLPLDWFPIETINTELLQYYSRITSGNEMNYSIALVTGFVVKKNRNGHRQIFQFKIFYLFFGFYRQPDYALRLIQNHGIP